MSGLSVEARDELDRRVRAIGWDDTAVEYGSVQRQRVAAMLVESGLVEDRLRFDFPNRAQLDVMVEYTTVKIVEKILGVGLVSKTGQWNWDGLWNPRMDASFSGWARQLAIKVAKTNARRVLHGGHELAASRFEDEDGHNPVWDDRSSRPVTAGGSMPGVFDLHPGLTVPRPIGPDRRMLTRLLTDGDATVMVGKARRMGWWHASLDRVGSDEMCAMLLLQPLPRRSKGLLAGLLSDMGDLPGLYEVTQMSSEPRDVSLLRRRVMEYAMACDCSEWTVWCRLGTATARLVAC